MLVFSHVPVHPESTSRECGDACLIWNYDEVLEVSGIRCQQTSVQSSSRWLMRQAEGESRLGCTFG